MTKCELEKILLKHLCNQEITRINFTLYQLTWIQMLIVETSKMVFVLIMLWMCARASHGAGTFKIVQIY